MARSVSYVSRCSGSSFAACTLPASSRGLKYTTVRHDSSKSAQFFAVMWYEPCSIRAQGFSRITQVKMYVFVLRSVRCHSYQAFLFPAAQCAGTCASSLAWCAADAWTALCTEIEGESACPLLSAPLPRLCKSQHACSKKHQVEMALIIARFVISSFLRQRDKVATMSESLTYSKMYGLLNVHFCRVRQGVESRKNLSVHFSVSIFSCEQTAGAYLSASSCSLSILSASESQSPRHADSTNCCSESDSLELAYSGQIANK